MPNRYGITEGISKQEEERQPLLLSITTTLLLLVVYRCLLLSLAMKTAPASQACISPSSPYVEPGCVYAVPKLLHTGQKAAQFVKYNIQGKIASCKTKNAKLTKLLFVGDTNSTMGYRTKCDKNCDSKRGVGKCLI